MNHEDKDVTKYLYDGDENCKVQLIESYGTDLTIVNSARVSFGENKQQLSAKDKKLIKYLIKHRHTSTLEHCGATFKIVVPLFIRSQHMRHRTFSFNEISRRYTDVDLNFYEPEAFRTQSESNRQASNNELIDPGVNFQWDESTSGYSATEAVHELHQGALYLYESMIEAGVCREQARGVLPQNLLTEYYATANLNNLLKFVDLRLHEGAQWEIQMLARAMLEIMEKLWGETVGAFKEVRGLG